MKLLFLFSQPWKVGGAETHVETLLKELGANRLFLAVNEGSDPKKLEKLRQGARDLTILTIQSRGANLPRWNKDLQRLADLIRREGIDAISAQQRTAGIWAYFLRRATGVPFVVTMHDPWHRAMWKSIYKKIFPQMIVVSRNLEEKLIARFGFSRERIQVIHNGVHFSDFAPEPKEAAREKTGLGGGEIILHVSRLSSVKGAVSLSLIDAMPRVWKTRPGARLVIVGEGPLRKAIEEKIRMLKPDCRGRVQIRGFVERIADWYNAADVIVGEGRVAIEALSCQKPVVAIRNAESFIGALDEQNIAYACDVNFDGRDQAATPEHIALEIETAFSLNCDESARVAGYIGERMSVKKMADEYLALFTRLCQGAIQ